MLRYEGARRREKREVAKVREKNHERKERENASTMNKSKDTSVQKR